MYVCLFNFCCNPRHLFHCSIYLLPSAAFGRPSFVSVSYTERQFFFSLKTLITPHAALEQWNLKIETAEKIVYLTREMCVTVFVRDIHDLWRHLSSEVIKQWSLGSVERFKYMGIAWKINTVEKPTNNKINMKRTLSKVLRNDDRKL